MHILGIDSRVTIPCTRSVLESAPFYRLTALGVIHEICNEMVAGVGRTFVPIVT